MNISFSQHALSQLKERGILRTAVFNALQSPDKIFQQSVKRFQVIKKIEKSGRRYLLIVIYDKIDFSHQQVVTAFITSKVRKYL